MEVVNLDQGDPGGVILSADVTGEPAPAVEQARQGLAIFDGLSSADPSNAIYARNVALCEEKLGDAFARSGVDTRAPGAQRHGAWSEARSWYQKGGRNLFQSPRPRHPHADRRG